MTPAQQIARDLMRHDLDREHKRRYPDRDPWQRRGWVDYVMAFVDDHPDELRTYLGVEHG